MSGEAPLKKRSNIWQYLIPFLLVVLVIVAKNYGSEIMSLLPTKTHTVNMEAETTSEEFAEYSYTLKLPVITASDADVQGFLNGVIDGIRHDANAAVASMKELAKTDAAGAETSGYTFRPHEYTIDFTVMYNRDNLLSLVTIEYFYSGGAHGMSVQKGYNLDLRNRKVLAITDLFEDVRTAKVIMVLGMTEQINNDPEGRFFEDAADRVGIADDQPFYLTNGGIVLHYGLYDLTPYAAGFTEFTFGVSELKNVLKPAIRRSLEKSLINPS